MQKIKKLFHWALWLQLGLYATMITFYFFIPIKSNSGLDWMIILLSVAFGTYLFITGQSSAWRIKKMTPLLLLIILLIVSIWYAFSSYAGMASTLILLLFADEYTSTGNHENTKAKKWIFIWQSMRFITLLIHPWVFFIVLAMSTVIAFLYTGFTNTMKEIRLG